MRYYEDRQLQTRVLPTPKLSIRVGEIQHETPLPANTTHDWNDAIAVPPIGAADHPANSGIRREPELPDHEEIAPEPRKAVQEFEPFDDELDDVQLTRAMRREARAIARQAALDPADDMGL